MRALLSLLLVCLLVGCQAGDPPVPPVPPPPEDLSTWTVPEVVHHAPPQPDPVLAKKEAPPTAAEKVYAYTAGETYTVPVSVGFPLDIVFRRGEQVHNITDGDRTPQAEGQTRRWEVRQGVEGVGEAQRHHVFVTVTTPGLKNGLIITTTRRTLYVTLESVAKSPIRVLRWHDEPDPAPVIATPEAHQGPLPALDVPARYHVGYEVQSSRQPAPTWVPRQVVDDGKKLYLLYPEVTLFETVPLVRLVGPNGPQLVNARQYLNVVILDQLAPRLELRVGIGDTAERVTITRGALKTITCPDDAECPHWPAAARTLTGRMP
jgi:type IV secretion system protein TrbG